MMGLFKKVFGTKNERELKSIQSILEQINQFQDPLRQISNEDLQAKTPYFKEQLGNGCPLDKLLPEAFAVVREASDRILKKRHFDVQLLGGIVLHQGKIAEMKTGEGKTLTATAPVYLNALMGKGVHVVTVNEYLTRIQAEEMGRVYQFLGLSLGCVMTGQSDSERKSAYQADITYGTNNELGFDYLRDNMKVSKQDFCQRGHFFAIVDEVDSILIDEARTPLIISGPTDQTSDKYLIANTAVRGLRRDIDYTVDEKGRACSLSEVGTQKVEERLALGNLYSPENIDLVHAVNQALKAQVLFQKDDHYIIQEGQIIIVDEFTGRLMQGRRYSDGLHQALEAKENVSIQKENQTLATVTLQNYFRMYQKLSGMTGTADTEAVEFHKIYGLDVVVIPTNKSMIRKDHDDILFAKQSSKFSAVADEILAAYQKGQPVLVGTVSIEKSELLSTLLNQKKVPHVVLNAKQHEKEATIIAEAGQQGKVTIATNMAGRGTDIILGPGVVELGGLYVIGTERHESRRIDNQLRGRSGRQGDPGESKFYLSWEDELMKRFNNRASQIVMRFAGDEPITDPSLTKVIGQVQKRVEGFNYDLRKHLLEYDDVLNKQRKAIYETRMAILEKADIKTLLFAETLGTVVLTFCESTLPHFSSQDVISVSFPELERNLFRKFNLVIPFTEAERKQPLFAKKELLDLLSQKLIQSYEEKEAQFDKENLRELERWTMLQTIDSLWKDHLLTIDHIKDGIGLRGYGQKDPLQEYKKEAFELFQRLIVDIKVQSLERIISIQPNLAMRLAEEIEKEMRTEIEALQKAELSSQDKVISLDSKKKQKKNKKS